MARLVMSRRTSTCRNRDRYVFNAPQEHRFLCPLSDFYLFSSRSFSCSETIGLSHNPPILHKATLVAERATALKLRLKRDATAEQNGAPKVWHSRTTRAGGLQGA
jgi:hypothetical protein